MIEREKDFCLIDVLLDNFKNIERERASSVFSPAMDIFQRKGEIVFEIELPGVHEKDIKVYLEDNKLMVKVKKSPEKSFENLSFYLLERQFGCFQKLFEISKDVKVEDIKAFYKNGILKILVPNSL